MAIGRTNISLGGVLIDYSTVEQKTGRKWIDGKPVYEKSWVLTKTTNTTELFSNGIPNGEVDTIIKIQGIRASVNNISSHALPMATLPSNTTHMCYMYVDYSKEITQSGEDTFWIYCQVGASGTVIGDKLYITMEYTKTTD